MAVGKYTNDIVDNLNNGGCMSKKISSEEFSKIVEKNRKRLGKKWDESSWEEHLKRHGVGNLSAECETGYWDSKGNFHFWD